MLFYRADSRDRGKGGEREREREGKKERSAGWIIALNYERLVARFLSTIEVILIFLATDITSRRVIDFARKEHRSTRVANKREMFAASLITVDSLAKNNTSREERSVYKLFTRSGSTRAVGANSTGRRSRIIDTLPRLCPARNYHARLRVRRGPLS